MTSKKTFPYKVLKEVDGSWDGTYYAIFELTEEISKEQFLEFNQRLIRKSEEDAQQRKKLSDWVNRR